MQAIQLEEWMSMDGEFFSYLARNELEDDHIGIFKLFLPEHDRWRNLCLYLHSTFYDTLRVISGAYSFPLLETLRIYWECGASSQDDHTNGLLHRIMKNSPLLRNLELFNFYDRFARVVPFEHHQVTSLCITAFCENEPGAVDIFRLFIHLEHLEINLDRIPSSLPTLSDPNDNVPCPQCHSSTLKTLVIIVQSMRSANRVIPSLVLPSLRSLELFFDYRETQDSEPNNEFSMQNLKNMLRHSPHIESFKLHNRMVIPSRDVSDMLAHVPSLTHLAIEADSLFFDDNFFLDMTLTPPSPAHLSPDEDIDTQELLPRLKSLDLTIRFLTYNTSGRDAPDPMFIINMIESRRNIHQRQDDTSVGSDQTKSEQSRIPTTLNELSHFRITAPIEDSSLPEDEKYGWHMNLNRLLQERLRAHVDRGLSFTQDLGPF
ncbi:hypothetical protein K435DRAFT_811709 [Dendrothele bispora CBS 962.96]|uniref:F-box domain-containing protein n=1 Tax=Dendrothele bispora (strain CBS 962.96) TaxID=1314807 RepID=A0A4S8KRG9_DENBC|nr:hypothetical protein K435DRAFT_811709 [Dendrothele bispora CBS 962.96]